ncbi:LysR family transcriptional regulator [Acuticoccus sp. I52.16.1]|uniref:LysR family transcriptional regulator n=1 Tax=Acuticoccus sp. I52.16.1 TaxID=2928472 RepID=UPI001FD5AEF3|nr:LysR family transcriptional regulator [Acuticoccus sp. I52.16.1]UOM35249.1 LysR family transcriptional regulator [Acuticoccus sp. I52.16.1]
MARRAGERDDDERGGGGPANGTGARIWLPLNALRAFEAVAKQQSFTAAAASLHVSQSALSRHVGRLEELIGRRLFDRKPGGVTLTAEGAALLPVLTASFDRIETTLRGLRQESAGPRLLRVHMPPTFLTVFGMGLLKEFRAAFPDVLIDVSSTNGVGLPAQRALDVAVVFDKPRVDDRVRDLLWTVSCTPAASPDMVAETAETAGGSLERVLARAELLHVKLEDEPFGVFWADYVRQRGLTIDERRGLAFDTEALAVQWAVGGGGVVLIDERTWGPEVTAGRLVTLGPRVDTAYGYYLTLHPDDLHDPAIALFRSFLIGRFAQQGA